MCRAKRCDLWRSEINSRSHVESVSLRAAAMTLRTVLLSLQALLAAAEPDDPQDAVVANQVRITLYFLFLLAKIKLLFCLTFFYFENNFLQNWKAGSFFKLISEFSVLNPQYKQNPEMFKQTARLWSHVYAGAPVSSPDYTRKIDKLCAMGFDKVRDTSLVLSTAFKHILTWHDFRRKQNFFITYCRKQYRDNIIPSLHSSTDNCLIVFLMFSHFHFRLNLYTVSIRRCIFLNSSKIFFQLPEQMVIKLCIREN